MKKFLVFATCLLVSLSTCLFAEFGGAGAATGAQTYGGALKKYISLQQGTTCSAWDNRGNVATYSPMTGVGDGTYYCRYDLYPGVGYNFMFFAVTGGSTPPVGLTGGATYYDAVPSSGDDTAFFLATSSVTPTAFKVAGAAYYRGCGTNNADARRYIVVPQDTGYSAASSSGIWVYNNWASTGVPSITVTLTGNTSVGVTLGAYTDWDTGEHKEEYKSIDIYGGGVWKLYRALGLGGNYALLASSTSAQLGASMTYDDKTGLLAGNTYYYIAITSDAYKGAMNALAADGCLARGLSDGTINPAGKTPTAVGYDGSARPADAIPVYFKVESPNWDYIKEHGNVVYLTPVGIDGKIWPYKIPGKICRVYLPKT